MCDEHVPLWLDARVVVQCAERQAVEGRLEIEAAKQRRPADAAKSAVRTGRRLIEGDKFSALRPAKVACFDTCATAKCGAVRLPAHRAMTVERATERTGDLISHSSAKAAASNHRSSLTTRVWRAEASAGRCESVAQQPVVRPLSHHPHMPSAQKIGMTRVCNQRVPRAWPVVPRVDTLRR
jgi:hypothetical protein